MGPRSAELFTDGPGHLIEQLLYFTLGFLCAAFLAALIAPVAWRRAVMLTRRRIEASVPLTLDEIRAEKDSLRAEHAVTARRLEMDVKALTHKLTGQSIELERDRRDTKSVAAEREALKAELATRETEARELREELRRREDGQQALSSALSRTEEMLKGQRAEVERLGKEFEQATHASTARNSEVVARDSEIVRLNSDLAALRGQRGNVEKMSKDASSVVAEAKRQAQAEKQRAERLDEKVQQLVADLSDREERLDRRDREIVRLRERLKPVLADTTASDNDLKLLDLQSENTRLEALVAELRQGGSDTSGSTSAAAEGETAAIRSQVIELTAENERLRERLESRPEEGGSARALREQMQALAAEVVHMTERVEGPGSPIHAALDRADPSADAPGDTAISLADRIRALRTASVRDQ